MKKLNIGLKEGILIDVTILLVSALLLLGFTLLKITEHILIKQQSQIARAYISSINNSVSYIYQTDPNRSFAELIESPAFNRLLKTYTDGGKFRVITVINKGLEVISSTEWPRPQPNGATAQNLHKKLCKKNDILRDCSTEELTSPIKLNRDSFDASVWKGDIEIQINRKGLDFWFLNEESKLEIYSPLYFGKKIKAGIVGKMPLSVLARELAKMRGLAFVTIAINAIVFIVFGWFLLSRGIIKPMTKLLEATEEISKGAYSYRIEMGEYKEISALSKSFNRMTEQLSEKTGRLKNTIEKLEQSNLELKAAQENLIRSEKLATTGRLAAGLAHEIGNPLGSITTYLDYLIKENEITDKNRDCLVRIEKEVSRIDSIVREFLDLASPSRGIITSVEINKTVSNMITLLKHRKDLKKIRIKQKIPGSFPPLKLDEQKLHQVLFNILLNSADAVKDGEEITITGETLDRKNQVRISIIDNGSGIEEKDLSKIFDPFYTTKGPGKGTGLGLSICQKIISDMGGNIEIESKVGKGTEVKIFLQLS